MIGLVVSGVERHLSASLPWMSWNLMLALVPWALAMWLFRDRRPIRGAGVILALVCLAFLPNASYVLTDVIHLPRHVRAEPSDVIVLFVVLPLFGVFMAVGFIAYVDTIRRISAWVREMGWLQRRWPSEVLLHVVSTVGIYLGRIHRFNSWDLLDRPDEIGAAFSARSRDRSPSQGCSSPSEPSSSATPPSSLPRGGSATSSGRSVPKSLAVAEYVEPVGGEARSGRRRVARLVVVVLLVLVCAAGALWTWWLPHYRPALHEGERYGIDVSNHQGDIDWTRVADDDIAFAYIKATEGGDWVDARFSTNWSAAGDAGLDRGAYHFFTLCRPGEEQADNFLEVARDVGELPPALDLEFAGNCSRRPDPEVVLTEVNTFLELVESATGEQVLLYIGDDFESVYPVRERLDRLLWHRRWYRRPNVDGWLFWQVTGMGHVDGIAGDVDLNVMRPVSELQTR